ncbi:MAG: DUF429 domain-containing protein [Smithella sp.]
MTVFGRDMRDDKMRILSVDLAHTSYQNLGIILLEETRGGFIAQSICAEELSLVGPPLPQVLAKSLLEACKRFSSRILILDGPQAWKCPDNGLVHSRVCERLLNTPGKTGLPGTAKPANYLPFIAFSITVFQELMALGFQLWSGDMASLLAIESFPLSAWRQLGLRPLPAKSKATMGHLQQAAGDLSKMFPLKVPVGLSHDQLQALVASLAGVPLALGRKAGYSVSGMMPSVVGGIWREGFIVNPTKAALIC